MTANKSKLSRMKKSRKDKSVRKIPRFNYGVSCDICRAPRKRKMLWSYKNRLGVMETRCKTHLRKPPTKKARSV